MEILYRPFIDHIKEASNGRLVIQLFANEELMPASELHQAISEGTLEAGSSCGAYTNDIVDLAYVEFGLPYAWSNFDEVSVIFEQMGLQDLCREAYAEANIRYNHVLYGPPYTMISAKPIDTLDHMRELKVRAVGMTATFLEKLGIQTTYIPGPEMYLALATGTVDAVVYTSATEYENLGLGEVTDYYLASYLTQVTNNFLINMDAWNSLPDDLKAIVELAGIEAASTERVYYMANEYEAAKRMGVEMVYLSNEDIATLVETGTALWDEVAAESPRNAQAVEILKARSRQLGLLD